VDVSRSGEVVYMIMNELLKAELSPDPGKRNLLRHW